ncbi:MAG: glycosyltransferase [Elusimicrobia bacterium]|nr:glycosyltransferase [Elusimicrobiota bacterium]
MLKLLYVISNTNGEKFTPFLFLLKKTGAEDQLIPKSVEYRIANNYSYMSIFGTIFSLFKFCRKIKPDIIVSFLWRANIVSAFVSLFCRIKLILAEHTVTDICISGYKHSFFKSVVLSLSYRIANKIIAVSDDVKDSLINYLKVDKNKVETIYNGVDIVTIETNSIEKVSLPFKEYLISCGRLEKEKNYSFLLEVINFLKQELSVNIPLVILGEGRERNKLEKKAKDLNIDLFMPGYIENPYPYIKNAKAFVLSSTYEGFPGVILEAMVLKTPIITVACRGGINEIIKNGVNGIIVEQNNIKAFASAIKDLKQNIPLKEKLVENAYKTVREKYDIKEMLFKYESIMEEIIYEKKI